jgi:hypothetical protein
MDDVGRTTGELVRSISASEGVWWVVTNPPSVGMNGYVLIPPEGHPWSDGLPRTGGRPSPVLDVFDVHGGITLAVFPWLGFSTNHPGDEWSFEYDPLGRTRRFSRYGEPLRRWSPTLVEYEARKLAVQVKMIESDVEVSNTGMSRFRHLDVGPTREGGGQ